MKELNNLNNGQKPLKQGFADSATDGIFCGSLFKNKKIVYRKAKKFRQEEIEFSVKKLSSTKDLQKIWNEFSEDKFEFKVLEEIEFRENLDIKRNSNFRRFVV